MSRVFILGSGFSASVGLPTQTNLFEKMLNEADYQQKEDDANIVYSSLKFLYPHFNQYSASPSFPPFEEYLTLVHISKDFGNKPDAELLDGLFAEETWNRSYKASVRLLTNFLSSCQEKVDLMKNSSLMSFCRQLKSGDTVITFNWDTLIERQLTELSIPFVLNNPDGGGVLLLKLHGSLSWGELKKNISPVHKEYFEVLDVYGNIWRSNDHKPIDTWIGLDAPPLIVPPILHKRPSESIFMRQLWFAAYQRLCNAKNCSIIGYSLPPEDYHARALLVGSIKAAMQINGDGFLCTVVNPNPAIAARFFAMVTNRIQFIQAKFTGSEGVIER